MQFDTKLRLTKLLAGTTFLGAVAYFLVPILLSITMNLLVLGIVGVLLFALWMVTPAIAEILGQISYSMFEKAIRRDPAIKLKRSLKEYKDKVRTLENKAADAAGQVRTVENQIREQAQILDEDEMSEWKERLDSLKGTARALIDARDQAIRDEKDFERQVTKYEAKLKLSSTFKSAFSALAGATDGIKNNVEVRTAMDEIDSRLHESQARIDMLISRPKEQPKQSRKAALEQLEGRTLDGTFTAIEENVKVK